MNNFNIEKQDVISGSSRLVSKSKFFDKTKYTLNNVVEIPWDVSNIQSGIYLARVIVNGDGKSEEKFIKVGVIK